VSVAEEWFMSIQQQEEEEFSASLEMQIRFGGFSPNSIGFLRTSYFVLTFTT
jgi:hypothetical protein